MKKTLLGLTLVAVSSALIYSCKTDTQGLYTQEQVDSIWEARLDSFLTAQRLAADSILNAEADSVVNATSNVGAATTSGKKSSSGSSTQKPSTNDKSEPKATTPTNPKDSRFDPNAKVEDNKDARFDEAAKQRQQEESAKKKAERF